MNVLVTFMFGIAVISIRAASRDRRGLGGVPLLCLCALVAVAYYERPAVGLTVLSVYEASAAESAADHLRHRERTWWILYALLIGATIVLGGLALKTAPRLLPQTLVLLGLGAVVALARPLAGLHLLTFFTLLGDASILPGYPFAKNLSSRESVFFIDDATTLSPLEIMLVATSLGLLLHAYVTPGWRFRRGALLSPFLVLAGLVVVGLLRAFVAGGNTNVALWEARPLLYLPLVYLLVTNLVTTPRQMIRLLMVAIAGVVANSLIALNSYRLLSTVQREALESLNEHSASVHIGALFILTLALWLFRGPLSLRVAFTALTALSLPTFLFSERRGAVVALGAGLILLSMVLFARSRRTFYLVVPILLILIGAYVGAFWGVEEGAAAFPAQAIKGVIAPGSSARRTRPRTSTGTSRRSTSSSPCGLSPSPELGSESRSTVRRPCPTSPSSSSGSTCRTTRCSGCG